jgi:hypothetical protein
MMTGRCSLHLVGRAGEVAFGFASQTAVFGGPVRLRLLIGDFGQESVGLPDLRGAGIQGLLDGQGFLGQFAGLVQTSRLGSQEIGEVAEHLRHVGGPRFFRPPSMALRYQVSAASGFPADSFTIASWFHVCAAPAKSPCCSFNRAASR